jgi:hypothetical protein
MATDWPVREFKARENWKCVSFETLKALRGEVMGHNDVTWR